MQIPFVLATIEYLAAGCPRYICVRQFVPRLPMRLLYLIRAVFFLLCQTCVHGSGGACPFADNVPGWGDYRKCLRNCLDVGGLCPVALALGCDSRVCMCQASFREGALNYLSSCVGRDCGTTYEPTQAVDVFNTFCGGVVIFTSVGAGLDTTGSPLSTEYFVKTVIATGGPMPTSTLTNIDEPMVASPTQTAGSTAQRGVALLWSTFITMIISLMAVTIWGWMAV